MCFRPYSWDTIAVYLELLEKLKPEHKNDKRYIRLCHLVWH